MDHTDNTHLSKLNYKPFSLYKFRRINKRLIESLLSQSLYFAKPDELNDPFDCRIDLIKVIKRAELAATGERKKFLSSLLGAPEFFEVWKSNLDTVGVLAFSRTNREVLLWSHYADEHRGLCLEYQFQGDHLLTEEFNLIAAGNVDYLAEPLTEWLKSAPMDRTKFVEELLHKYLKTKSPAWKYEQESRIIRRPHGPFKFNIRSQFLSEVCFGLRTPPADIDLVTNLAQNYCGCTKFSQMVHAETEFSIVKKAL